MANHTTRIEQFDQVRIRTTRNVTYLSAPPGTNTTPDGIWSVVSAIDKTDLLLAKSNIIIRIPATDVLKIKGNITPAALEILGKLSQYGQETEDDQSSGD